MENTFFQLLNSILTGVAANELFSFMHAKPTRTPQEVESFLRLHRAEVYAPKVLSAFAANGRLTISESALHGEAGSAVGAGAEGEFSVEGSTISAGGGSSVRTGLDGQLTGGNGAYVVQEKGSVCFVLGRGSNGGINIVLGRENFVVTLGAPKR